MNSQRRTPQLRSWFLALGLVLGFRAAAMAGVQDPDLDEILRAARSGETFSVIVRLKDSKGQQRAEALSGVRDRSRRGERVVRTLREHALQSQESLRQRLEQGEQQGAVVAHRPFWIFNGIALTATAETIRELADRDDVASVSPDRVITLAPATALQASITSTWNLQRIGAPALWAQGFRGQGVVVASMDTGVDVRHPALMHKWRGGNNSWYDPYGHSTVPYDRDGHGTGVMGIMVAGNTSSNPVGIAPAALWIAAKIFDDQGNGTLSAIHAAFQWLLDPDGNPATADAPDVVNNSWDMGNYGQVSQEFAGDIQMLRAAGIAVVFSAGNGSMPLPPQTNTSVSPANNAGAFAVGASDVNDLVPLFSSRGPSASGGGIYPALVAPGVNVRSTDLNGTYAQFTNLGTSYAAPHVSGAMALLLSGRPSTLVANPDGLGNALIAGAVDLGSPGPDNSSGNGRLDVAAAVQRLGLAAPVLPTGDVNGDGRVDIADALLVAQAAVGSTPVTARMMVEGDVAPLAGGHPVPDGAIDLLDLLVLLQKSAGLVNF